MSNQRSISPEPTREQIHFQEWRQQTLEDLGIAPVQESE